MIEDTAGHPRRDRPSCSARRSAELVEGVTKLSQLELTAEHMRQAENLRKFILAISKDVRVLLVKLADRLHNMRTLQFIESPAKRERIARETLDIYAPLARSIGCHRICSELEELAFEHLNPMARDAIVRRLETLRAGAGPGGGHGRRGEIAESAGGGGHRRPGSFGREKTALFDLAQAAAQVDRLLPAFRHLRLPRDRRHRGRLLPRAGRRSTAPGRACRSGSRTSSPPPSATTTARCTPPSSGRAGMRIEMQIRTEAMDRVAEEGVAAHWRYKDKSYGFDPEAAEARRRRAIRWPTCATSSRCWSTAATPRSWSSTPSSRCSSTRCSSSRPRAG